MKRIFIAFFLVMLIICNSNAGELQKQYEKQNIFPINNQNLNNLLLDDYRAYLGNGGSIYGVILYQLDVLKKDTIDYVYINKAKLNYDAHFVKTDEWEYIDVPDAEYKEMLDSTKNILNFNNSVYKNK